MSRNEMNALITCEVTDDFLSSLTERGISFRRSGWGLTGVTLQPNEIIREASDCQILIVELEQLNRELIQRLPNVKFIGVSRGAPVNVDLDYCRSAGITVVHTPGRNADSVADYCLGMMLALTRKLVLSRDHLKNYGWMYAEKLPYLEFRGNEIGSLTIGLYGLGQIGHRVAKRLQGGFGSQVLFFDPFVETSEHAKKVDSLEELFSQSDIVSLHAPVLKTTQNTVNRNLLRMLGSEGYLIGSARADLIVEPDLYASLLQGEIAGAALDVFWEEPLTVDSPWLHLPNVLCTPHIAGASLNVVENHCREILTGIDNWIATQQSIGEGKK